MSKRFGRYFVLLFMSIVYMLGLAHIAFADIYGVYSEHYRKEGSFKNRSDILHFKADEIPKSEPYLTDDGGLWWFVPYDSSMNIEPIPTNLEISTAPMEGVEAMSVYKGTAITSRLDLRFSFTDEYDVSSTTVRDLSAYKFMRFNWNLQTTDPVSIDNTFLVGVGSYGPNPDDLNEAARNSVGLGVSSTKPLGEWTTYIMNIELATTIQSIYLSSVTYILLGESDARVFLDPPGPQPPINFYTTWYFDNVVLMSDLPTALKVSTSYITTDAITVPKGLKKIISVEAYDKNGDISTCNPPIWSTDASTDTDSVIVRPRIYQTMYDSGNSYEGSALITASTTVRISTVTDYTTAPETGYTWDSGEKEWIISLTGYANINVATVTWNTNQYMFSDDVQTGDMGITKADDGTTCTVSTTTVEKAEGTKSLKVDYDINSSTSSWAGIYFNDGSFVDFTAFSTTTAILDFYVKTSTDLVVSIRSANLSDDEAPKVRLSEYGVTLDNTWQRVQIVLDDFKQRNLELDFSQIVTYFSIAVVGGRFFSVPTDPGTFYVDGIRWRTPETLSAVSFTTPQLKLRLDNSTTDQINWIGVDASTKWAVSQAYIEVGIQGYSSTSWGLQIYTDNEAAEADPQYSHNESWKGVATSSRNPVGLVCTTTGRKHETLPMCWRITDSTRPVTEMQIVEHKKPDNIVHLSTSTTESYEYYVWMWMKDKNTQANSGEGVTAFVNGEIISDFSSVVAWHRNKGLQHAEATWAFASSPNYIYIGAKFWNAGTPLSYKTNQLKLEFYTE